MPAFIFGNDPNQTLTVATGDISGDLIKFGTGDDDGVNVEDGNITNDTIGFGNGNADTVFAYGSISNDIITLGNGQFDGVFTATGNVSNDMITLGNGQGDTITSGSLSNTSITLGSGVGDFVDMSGSANNNKITLGDGSNDFVLLQGSTGNNKIILGNGQNDSVTLGPASTSPGGDYIATGTGANNSVTVGAHVTPDTFAFALGTGVVTGGSANYTTVNGAQVNDLIVVNSNGNGNALGNTLVVEQTQTADMASFITSLGTLTKGDTYIGYNVGGGMSGMGNGATETFIVTDSQSGKMAAIELVGVFHPTQADLVNHVLTLA